MPSLEENIKLICEHLAEELSDPDRWNKDKAMVLNNLAEFVMPKRTRSSTKDESFAPDNTGF